MTGGEQVFTFVLDAKHAYLEQHRIDGVPVLPAAVALEMMAQATRSAWDQWKIVEVREADINHSFWDNTLEARQEEKDHIYAVRIGLRQIDGFHWLDEDEERLKQSQASFRNSPSFRGVAIATNPNAQLRIGEPRDSGFDASASPPE